MLDVRVRRGDPARDLGEQADAVERADLDLRLELGLDAASPVDGNPLRRLLAVLGEISAAIAVDHDAAPARHETDDLIARERANGTKDLHARFGGDEFCFLIPDFDQYHQAYAIAERFREAVERYDWTSEDGRLAVQPVRVDVGVVCLRLGRVAERQFIARRLADGLIQRADKLMYEAKHERASHIYMMRLRVEHGDLVEITDGSTSASAAAAT